MAQGSNKKPDLIPFFSSSRLGGGDPYKNEQWGFKIFFLPAHAGVIPVNPKATTVAKTSSRTSGGHSGTLLS